MVCVGVVATGEVLVNVICWSGVGERGCRQTRVTLLATTPSGMPKQMFRKPDKAQEMQSPSVYTLRFQSN